MPHETQHSLQGQRFEFDILGVPVAFRATADLARIETAKRLIEERYEDLKSHGRQASREQLLMILMIGIADGMLHVQQETDRRVRELLLQIEESEKDARSHGQ